jgi:polar amino acid transport system substrate-binding protein
MPEMRTPLDRRKQRGILLSIVLLLVLCAVPLRPAYGATDELTAKPENTAGRDDFDPQEPVSLALLNNFPPFAFEYRGELVGFTVDYVSLLEEKTGIDFDIVSGTWEDIFGKFRRGEVDVITALSYTEDRTAFTLYSDPYYLIPTVVYTREEGISYKGVESLQNKTVGIEAGVFYKKYLQRYPSINVREIEDTEELMRSLSFGEVDAVLTNINIGNFMIKRFMLENVKLAGRIDISGIEDEDLRIGVRRERPELFRVIQEGMNRISASEYKELQDRWADFAPAGIRQRLLPEEYELIGRYKDRYGGIRLAVCQQWRPIDYTDSAGKHSGIVADFYDKTTEAHNIRFVKQSSGSLEKSLNMLQEGEVDAVPAVVPTSELRSEFSLTKPYLSLPLVAVTRSKEFIIGGLGTLQGERIGCMKRGDLAERLTSSYTDLDFHTVETVREGLSRVRSEKDYAFVGTIPAVAYAIKHYNFYNLKVAGTLEESIALAAAVRKGDTRLRSVLEKSLNSIPQDARDRIVDRWLAVSLDEPFDYTLLWRITAVIIVIVVVIVAWTRKVHSYNKQITEANRLLEEKNRELEHLSVTNQLTGLFNRNKLDAELEKEFGRYSRYGRPFSLILGDIDGFKEVNDTLGHQTGDEVLRLIGRLIRDRVRTADIPGRWGGEEFLVICPETDEAGALLLAEEIREAVEADPFEIDQQVTMSFGVTEVGPELDVESMVRSTDERLYLAKEYGKNRIVGSSEKDDVSVKGTRQKGRGREEEKH